jgi:hypothetical protein
MFSKFVQGRKKVESSVEVESQGLLRYSLIGDIVLRIVSTAFWKLGFDFVEVI